MARIRSVKPELADDEKLGSISRDARLLFIMMWCHSDDFGVVKGNLRWLQSQIFPYDPVKPEQFKKWVDELMSIDAIRPFEKNNENFFYIKNFQKHQVINKPSKQARNPEPPEEILRDDSRSAPVVLPEDYAEEGNRKGTGREGKGKERYKGDDLLIPDWIPLKAWASYLEMRGPKMSIRAKELAMTRLEELWKEGSPPDQVLNQSVMYGWKGLFPVKQDLRIRGAPLPYSDKTATNIAAAQRLIKKMEEQDGG